VSGVGVLEELIEFKMRRKGWDGKDLAIRLSEIYIYRVSDGTWDVILPRISEDLGQNFKTLDEALNFIKSLLERFTPVEGSRPQPEGRMGEPSAGDIREEMEKE